MILNDRKIEILKAIVNDYIQTAEPIGSRTIAKKYGIGVSSATIRNEMSDLEEMGLIVQPHASSGRVPSDKGYRLYVDKLMNFRELNNDQLHYLKQMIHNNINQIDFLMQETAKAIALLTNYTTIVSEPQRAKQMLKHVQLVPLDETGIILVAVLDNKVVKNQQIKLSKAPEYTVLNDISVELNKLLKLCPLTEISTKQVEELCTRFDIDGQVIVPVLETISDIMQTESDFQVYTSGVRNILSFPEFSNLEKATGIFQALEEREILINLLYGDDTDGREGRSEGVQIVIGAENALEQMKNCSIIKANYLLDNQISGSIGIIGPTRMDYAQVVAVLSNVVKNMNLALIAMSGG